MNTIHHLEAGILVPMSEVNKILTDVVKMAYTQWAIENGKEKAVYSISELYRKYTRPTVDEWLTSGRLKPVQLGKSLRYCKMEVDALAHSDVHRIYKVNFFDKIFKKSKVA